MEDGGRATVMDVRGHLGKKNWWNSHNPNFLSHAIGFIFGVAGYFFVLRTEYGSTVSGLFSLAGFWGGMSSGGRAERK